MKFKRMVILLAVIGLSLNLYAKRRAPEPVEPVTFQGIEYRAPTEKMGYVQAWKNNQLLWEKKVYTILYNPLREKDVQDVFITDLQIEGNVLTVRNEKDKTYTIDIDQKTDLPSEERDVASEIVQGNTAFAMDLYKQLSTEEGNLFFSPYSLSTALAMVYGGARGQTADQMARTMHYDIEDSDFHQHFGELIASLNEQGQKGNYKLLVANALWGQEDFAILDDYLNLTEQNYDASLQQVDFVNDRKNAAQTINDWVEEKTEDKIKNLISPEAIDAGTRLILTNAIYFKGNWADQFEKEQTEQAPFYLNDKDTVQVPLMHRVGDYNYAETEGLQVLQLPYKADELSMVVLLPKQRGTQSLEKELSADALSKWTSKLSNSEVDVYLPKFKMTSKFELSNVLSNMGMKDAFSTFSQAADFSGMTGKKDLFISKVIHDAYVDVNEKGTEAAAATGVLIEAGCSTPIILPVFRADRPFIFFIKDNATGSMLFMGRVSNPTK